MKQSTGQRQSQGMDLFEDARRETRGGSIGEGRDTLDMDKLQKKQAEQAAYKEIMEDTPYGQNPRGTNSPR